jgi:hypothetical protein
VLGKVRSGDQGLLQTLEQLAFSSLSSILVGIYIPADPIAAVSSPKLSLHLEGPTPSICSCRDGGSDDESNTCFNSCSFNINLYSAHLFSSLSLSQPCTCFNALPYTTDSLIESPQKYISPLQASRKPCIAVHQSVKLLLDTSLTINFLQIPHLIPFRPALSAC